MSTICRGVEGHKVSPSDERKLVGVLRINPRATKSQACHEPGTAGTPVSQWTALRVPTKKETPVSKISTLKVD